MTKLFQLGIEAVEALPDDLQDVAGAFLLEMAAGRGREYQLTKEQLEDLKLSIAEADRGEFASDEEMEEVWHSFGR